ncbi:hypothetical protein P3S38_27665, partial [Enterobacter hormaechei]|uniref:hypothetical protein n=1 Tax=Enterobacter hormaechei TaxID=158836 RepID=UPI0023E47759
MLYLDPLRRGSLPLFFLLFWWMVISHWTIKLVDHFWPDRRLERKDRNCDLPPLYPFWVSMCMEDHCVRIWIDQLEALLARRFHRGKGKFKGKMPIICFNCNEVGHIAARCPNKQNKDEKKGYKYNGKKDFKSFKDKGKKTYFMAKNSNGSDDEEEDEIV